MSDPSRTGMIARDFPIESASDGSSHAACVGRFMSPCVADVSQTCLVSVTCRGKFVAFRMTVRRSISWMGLRVQVGIH